MRLINFQILFAVFIDLCSRLMVHMGRPFLRMLMFAGAGKRKHAGKDADKSGGQIRLSGRR